MGNKGGREHGAAPPQAAHEQPKNRGGSRGKAEDKASDAEAAAVLAKSYDVVISSTPADTEMSDFIKSRLESASIPCYCNSSESEDATKLVGKVLVDAKLLVFVVSDPAASSSVCQDQVSLAYISNKPIVAASVKSKEDLIKGFQVGMRLTLQGLAWTTFANAEERETVGRGFVQLVQENLSKPVHETADVVLTTSLTSAPTKKARINTKLRQQTTVRDEQHEGPLNTFWDRNFPTDDEVPWFKFQQAFLTDYEAQLSGLFNEDNIPWLLDMLKNDVFDGADKITKGKFMEVRGESPDKNAFWRSVSQTAVEKFNMQEVFNMKSSVRLTAIEKLAKFGSPAVIDALRTLLTDEDPNVRAVAAISLGRTGSTDERIVDELINLLSDKDRIVRQSACLSLGSMKAEKAIPHIGHVWRNDFISVVRNAARSALETMDTEASGKVLRVTKILEDEIATLETKHANV